MPTSVPQRPQSPSSESILGESSQVRGRVVGDGDLRVLGTIDGEVSLHGALTIGDGGAVRGQQCEARDVSVYGELVADVTAEGAIVVHPGATVRGKLRAGSVRLHEGANVSADLDAAFELPAALR